MNDYYEGCALQRLSQLVTLLNLVRSQRKTTKVPSSPFSDATSLSGTYVGWVVRYINATRLLNLVEHFPAEAATPKAPDTPLANSQELSARVVAQRIVPFRSAVLRFIGPQARVVNHRRIGKETS